MKTGAGNSMQRSSTLAGGITRRQRPNTTPIGVSFASSSSSRVGPITSFRVVRGPSEASAASNTQMAVLSTNDGVAPNTKSNERQRHRHDRQHRHGDVVEDEIVEEEDTVMLSDAECGSDVAGSDDGSYPATPTRPGRANAVNTNNTNKRKKRGNPVLEQEALEEEEEAVDSVEMTPEKNKRRLQKQRSAEVIPPTSPFRQEQERQRRAAEHLEADPVVKQMVVQVAQNQHQTADNSSTTNDDGSNTDHSTGSGDCGSRHQVVAPPLQRRPATAAATHTAIAPSGRGGGDISGGAAGGGGGVPVVVGGKNQLGVTVAPTIGRKELIGKGSFGFVYRAMDLDTNRMLAVKEIPMLVASSSASSVRGGGGGGVEEQLRKEMAMLQRLDHPNIVKYLGSDCDDQNLRIFMEFVPGGTVTGILRTFGPLREKQASILTRQMLSGLHYLHGQKIAHRDLKGDNLLVDVDGTLKLADFGTAKELVATKTTSIAGTAHYMAPEVIRGTGHGTEADIWSLGCCVIEMLTGRPPFSDMRNQYAIMMKVAESAEATSNLIPPLATSESTAAVEAAAGAAGGSGLLPPAASSFGVEHSSDGAAIPTQAAGGGSPGVSQAARNFLMRCLVRDPLKRASCAELLQDEWILAPPVSTASPTSSSGGSSAAAAAVAAAVRDHASRSGAGKKKKERVKGGGGMRGGGVGSNAPITGGRGIGGRVAAVPVDAVGSSLSVHRSTVITDTHDDGQQQLGGPGGAVAGDAFGSVGISGSTSNISVVNTEEEAAPAPPSKHQRPTKAASSNVAGGRSGRRGSSGSAADGANTATTNGAGAGAGTGCAPTAPQQEQASSFRANSFNPLASFDETA